MTAAEPSPAHPKDAASVVLVRQGGSGVEVFLIRRVPQMAFAPGFTVFPGGGVDEQDRSAETTCPEHWPARFQDTPGQVAALGRAAARELFEECGVLLARGASALDGGRAYAARGRIDAKELTFGGFLGHEGLSIDFELLRPLAHWITPVSEPRRFDTRFFLAVLPEGQEADGHTTESAQSVWRSPAEALDPTSAQPCLLLPPTWSLLRWLASHETVAGVVEELDARREPIPSVMPAAAASEDGRSWSFPGAEEYLAWSAALAAR
ncbi:MAG: NUDIX hydrolase [Segniliparus sp.]|uniref:NUDIX hydrolase n=1 Tax=Segniliparus sp. TaxID=2804064 RepID=UPI003F33EB99